MKTICNLFRRATHDRYSRKYVYIEPTDDEIKKKKEQGTMVMHMVPSVYPVSLDFIIYECTSYAKQEEFSWTIPDILRDLADAIDSKLIEVVDK